MAKKYRKKPVVIEAVQWTGRNLDEVHQFMGECLLIEHGNLCVDTSEGKMKARPGDYIIKEPFDKERKFYPCKLTIFRETYEEVKE